MQAPISSRIFPIHLIISYGRNLYDHSGLFSKVMNLNPGFSIRGKNIENSNPVPGAFDPRALNSYSTVLLL